MGGHCRVIYYSVWAMARCQMRASIFAAQNAVADRFQRALIGRVVAEWRAHCLKMRSNISARVDAEGLTKTSAHGKQSR